MSTVGNIQSGACPICNRIYQTSLLEQHVNKCIFLNSVGSSENQNKKRSLSPTLSNECQSQSRLTFSQNQNPKKLSRLSSKSKISSSISEITNATDSVSQVESGSSSSKYKSCKDELFNVPLPKQLQPKSLDDFVGQDHIMSKNSLLRTLLERGEIPNMILWGPPGCGKTSLSAIINEMCKANPKKQKFVSMCAATVGVKEVQNVITIAKNEMKFGRNTILFMDEIHRFNKRQQDTFLLSVERGDIVLIGATTENPSFSINNALLSRCRVIVLEKLQSCELLVILEKAAENLDIDIIDEKNPCLLKDDSSDHLSLNSSALQWLADISDGDARIALSNLQLVVQHYNSNNQNHTITTDDLKNAIKKSHLLYDRKGEEHYNVISAMHKSIRGSDANAALYWTTRMIVSGEDPLFIARRMVRAASEDIGNADPNALQLAVSTMQGCQLLGMPESDCLLAQCAIYLARAPKSREADSALAKAKKTIVECKGIQPPVPMHIRNAPTKLMQDLGYGRQRHEDDSFLPPELKDVDFFT